MKIDIFIPCFIDQFRPQTALNMIKVLEKAGCVVNYNTEQTCCGLPAFNAGYWDDAREVSEKLLSEVSLDRNLVCGASACVGMIRNSYDLLFQNSSFHNKFRQLQKKTFELSEFLVDVLKISDLGAKFEGKVAFMDTCTARNECNIKSQPRLLLEKVEGIEIVEIKNQEQCCGFGGTFSTNYSKLSVALAKDKIDDVLATGADYIVSCDYSCLLHLESYIKTKNIKLKVLHIADILASGL